MIEILPAVLPRSHKELEASLMRLRGVVRRVQVDAVDGRFVRMPGFSWSGASWPYRDGARFKQTVEDGHGLPLWGEMDFEFDLMVADPAAEAPRFVRAGASRIILHAASPTAPAALQELVDLREEGGAMSVRVGMALGVHQTPDDLLSFEDQFDFVQVMGVARIGRQGQPLDSRTQVLLERLRRRYPNLPLQVDGGVRLENARSLVAAGATSLVAGSAILGAADPKAAYEALYNEANG